MNARTNDYFNHIDREATEVALDNTLHDLKRLGYSMDFVLNEMLKVYRPERIKLQTRIDRTMDTLVKETL